MKKTFDVTQAAIEAILKDIQNEVLVIAKIYDSRDLFGIAYGKFAEKINDMIEEYIEK